MDEAGRGCYAGPVFAAAVILPRDFHHEFLNDSKQLSADQREELRGIIQRDAVCWQVASVSSNEIDQINILQASFKAMHKAIRKLSVKPDHLIIDGNRFKNYRGVQHTCVIKGDGQYFSIAAASVLAKTYRDDFMRKLHKKYPHYNWHNNKGYGTAEHRTAIDAHGLCEHHRKSFNIWDTQLELF